MTIRTSLIEYFGETEGDTIAKVLRSGLDAEGDTIEGVISDSIEEGDVDDDPEVVGNSDASEAGGE